MNTDTKQFIITFPRIKKPAFFELIKKHIVKGKKGNHNLSQDIDKILYGKK